MSETGSARSDKSSRSAQAIFDLEVNDFPSDVNKEALNNLCSVKGRVIELNDIKDKAVR